MDENINKAQEEIIEKKPKKKASYLGLVIFIFIAIIGISSMYKNQKDKKEYEEKLKAEKLEAQPKLVQRKDNTVSQPNKIVPAEKKDDVKEAKKKEEKKEKIYKIGKKSILGDWEITLTKFEIIKKINEYNKDYDYYSYFEADPGNKYACVHLTVKNNGKDSNSIFGSYSFNDPYAKILYKDYEYSSSRLLASNQDLHETILNPLTSQNGILAFEIPDDVASSKEKLYFVIIDNKGKEIKYKIR